MKPKSTVFLTGATGLLGSYLLKILLKNNHKVYCLARAKEKKSAKERVKDVLNFWDKEVLKKHKDNLVVLEGDITKKNLGLTNSKVSLLKKEINEIFHCAAVTKFNWPLNKIRKVNVGGTKNVLEFALQCKNLKKVNHISTGYVCGDYKGVFKETDLDVGQKFNTTYLQSKFEAEKLVHKYRKKGLWIDIFRPPFVLGEARTGKILSFEQGFYQLLHIYALGIFESYPVKGIFLNSVFVDELADGIYTINSYVKEHNQTYHPFSAKKTSLESILVNLSYYLNVQISLLLPPDKFDAFSLTPIQKAVLTNNLFLYNSDVVFNCANTNRILKNGEFKFTPLDKNHQQIIFSYCLKRRFLKRYEAVLH